MIGRLMKQPLVVEAVCKRNSLHGSGNGICKLKGRTCALK